MNWRAVLALALGHWPLGAVYLCRWCWVVGLLARLDGCGDGRFFGLFSWRVSWSVSLSVSSSGIEV